MFSLMKCKVNIYFSLHYLFYFQYDCFKGIANTCIMFSLGFPAFFFWKQELSQKDVDLTIKSLHMNLQCATL